VVEGARGGAGLEEGEHGDGGGGGGGPLLGARADEVAAAARAIGEEHMPGLVGASSADARKDQEGQEDQDRGAAHGDTYDGSLAKLRGAL
jgi:hypothetical protein